MTKQQSLNKANWVRRDKKLLREAEELIQAATAYKELERKVLRGK